MSKLEIPVDYVPLLNLKQTELGIKNIKDFFQVNLSSELRLRRVTAPLFVESGTGINDDLNGGERPKTAYEIEKGFGIYTDMNAIRADEELDNLHSLYVDQWDWELVIGDKDRTINYLKQVVRRIYAAMLRTEYLVYELFPSIKPQLPAEITFIHSEELLQQYPGLDVKQREDAITEGHGAVFVMGIGASLSNGIPHDGRAPDYDDWSTPNTDGYTGLNGDLLIWNPVLKKAVEISSMGIRVDAIALERQLKARNKMERLSLYFHKRLMNNELPLSIGGGIGQSRLCMHYLRKAHIGEIQASLWPNEMKEEAKKKGVFLL